MRMHQSGQYPDTSSGEGLLYPESLVIVPDLISLGVYVVLGTRKGCGPLCMMLSVSLDIKQALTDSKAQQV